MIQANIAFISFDEPLADTHWSIVQSKSSTTECFRVHNVVGIHNAHRQAALTSKSEWLWVVDGDAQLVDEFSFQLPLDLDVGSVYVWRSINNCNKLVYGNGGVKLFPTQALANLNVHTIDMTSSLGLRYRVVDVVSNYTVINQTPFHAWRAAFRETVKLSKSLITNPDKKTAERLAAWGDSSLYVHCQYGDEIIRGYQQALNIDIKDVGLINDYQWLKEQYGKQ